MASKVIKERRTLAEHLRNLEYFLKSQQLQDSLGHFFALIQTCNSVKRKSVDKKTLSLIYSKLLLIRVPNYVLSLLCSAMTPTLKGENKNCELAASIELIFSHSLDDVNENEKDIPDLTSEVYEDEIKILKNRDSPHLHILDYELSNDLPLIAIIFASKLEAKDMEALYWASLFLERSKGILVMTRHKKRKADIILWDIIDKNINDDLSEFISCYFLLSDFGSLLIRHCIINIISGDESGLEFKKYDREYKKLVSKYEKSKTIEQHFRAETELKYI